MKLLPPAGEYGRYAWDGVLLTVTSALTGLFFYLVHPLVSRLMRAEDYTALVTLLALLKVMSVPSSAMQVVMARVVARYAQDQTAAGWVTLVRRAAKKIAALGVLGLVLWVGFCPLFYRGLGAPSAVSMAVLGVIGLITLFQPIVQGTLQGASRFGWTAASGMSMAVARVVFMVVVAALGGGVAPVLGAVAASMGVGLLLGYVPFAGILARTPSIAGLDTRPMYRFLWPVLIGMALLQILNEADLILCARLLEEPERGIYARVAMVARMAIYLPIPIVIAMFPRAVASDRRWIVAAPLLFTLFCGVATALLLTWLAPWVLALVFAVEGAAYEALLRAYVWATIPLALCTILSHYLWARGRAGAILLLLPVVAGYLLALKFLGADGQSMVVIMGVASFVGALLLALPVFCGRPRAVTS